MQNSLISNNIKVLLKQSNTLTILNTWIKAHLQERTANKSADYYRSKASKRELSTPKGGELAVALSQHLISRGINLVSKPKGDLHIFLAYPLNNWEYILPIALQPFGRVTEFEWTSLEFNHHPSDLLKWRESMNTGMLEAFIKAYDKQPVDTVVGYLSGINTSPETLRKMANRGTVIFNFCWDDKLYFKGNKIGDRWLGPAAIAGVVDLNLTNAPDSCIKYMVEGGLAMFWPEAAHSDIHKPYDVPFEYDVSFVGGKYGWRQNFIKRLQKMGINVACFGNGWENGPLSDDEMVKVYSRSRINLGFAGVGHSKKLMCLKARDFEVPMSGGLYLTQNNSELSLVYNVGKEIVTYQNEKDCSEKIKSLLRNPDEADKIRKAGRIRALKDHTWEQRFEDVFSLAGLLKKR